MEDLRVEVEILHSVEDENDVFAAQIALDVLELGSRFGRGTRGFADVVKNGVVRIRHVTRTGEKLGESDGKMGFTGAVVGDDQGGEIRALHGELIGELMEEADIINPLVLAVALDAKIVLALEDEVPNDFVRKLRLIEPIRLDGSFEIQIITEDDNVLQFHSQVSL